MTGRITATLTLVLSLLCPLLAWAQAPGVLENEFIRVVVNKGPDEAGRFSIKTTGGDQHNPATKNQHLIFGGNTPWTSYTTVRVDDDAWVFGGGTHRRAGLTGKYGTVTSEPTVANGRITTVTQTGDIEAVQELAIARGSYSHMLDTVRITYRLKNTGAVTHRVGLRVLLDTMCGSNDGAPIQAGKYEKGITTATAIAGGEVPDIWQAFDDLAHPTITSQGTLSGDQATRPDSILFADWGTLADHPWQPTVQDGQSFVRAGENELDSAAALFWNPVSLEPGKTLVYVTYYGMGKNDIAPGKLSLGLTAPMDTTFQHEQTAPFTVIGYLKNAGGYEARDVSLTLVLPDGLELVNGQATKTKPTMGIGDTLQESWLVRANGQAGGKKALKLTVTSGNVEGNEVAREIQINVPKPAVKFVPGAAQVPATMNHQNAIVPVAVNLIPAEKCYGVRLVIKYNPDVLKPLDVSRGRAFVEGGKLLAGWEYTDTVPGQITITGRRTGAAAITQAEANLATITFRAVGVGKCALHLDKAALLNEKDEEGPVDAQDGTLEVVAQPIAVADPTEAIVKSAKELDKAALVQTEDLARTRLSLAAAKETLEKTVILLNKAVADNTAQDANLAELNAKRTELEKKVAALQKQLDDMSAMSDNNAALLAKRLSEIDKLIADNDKKYADAMATQKAEYEKLIVALRADLDKEHMARLAAEAKAELATTKIRKEAKRDRTVGLGISGALAALIAVFAL
jgi:hypothetical protein